MGLPVTKSQVFLISEYTLGMCPLKRLLLDKDKCKVNVVGFLHSSWWAQQHTANVGSLFGASTCRRVTQTRVTSRGDVISTQLITPDWVSGTGLCDLITWSQCQWADNVYTCVGRNKTTPGESFIGLIFWPLDSGSRTTPLGTTTLGTTTL